MSTISFVGIALELESVTQIALATVRVKLTQDPLASSPVGVHDALNPANWSVVGPGIANITSVGIVPGDTQSVDLFLSGPLAIGLWNVTASTNIQTATGASITAPFTLPLNVATSGAVQPVNPGASNDSDEDILRKHLNEALAGKGWDALIAAIATGEQKNRLNARYAFDQLFTSTASGLYLERKASDSGIDRPDNMGISDETFREFVIQVTNDKLTEESFLEVLKIFYGDAALRANSVTGTIQPYALQEGDDLQIVVDGDLTVNCIFHTADFASIGVANSIEVASAITRAFRGAGSTAYAAATVDPVTGISTVTIYSGSLGLSSSIQIISGKAQNALQFPTKLPVYTLTTSPTWTITVNAATGTTRFTSTSTNINLSLLRSGDYVNIYGTEFNAGNRGSLPVTAVSVTYPSGVLTQYFEVANLKGVAQAGLVQTAQSSIFYFRPSLSTVHSTTERTALVSSQSTLVDVVMPATSQAVARTELTAAYAQSNSSIAVTSLVRSAGIVTAVAPSHGRSNGDWIYIDGAVANITPPTITAGNGTTLTSYAATSVASVTLTTAVSTHIWGPIVSLVDGRVLFMGGSVPGGTTGVTTTCLMTITGTTPHTPNGTQYTLTNVADATTTLSAFGAAVRLTSPTAGNKVLYCGGTNNGMSAIGTPITTATLYTPGSFGSTGSWAATGSTVDARAGHAIIQLSNGNVLIMGGVNNSGTCWATVEQYTTALGTWAHTANGLDVGLCQPECIQLKNTDVVVCGGRTSVQTKLDYTTVSDVGTLSNGTQVYNIGGGTWTRSGAMTAARVGHKLFLLDDGRVIAIGGIGYDPTVTTTQAYLSSTEIYDPTLKIWLAGPTMRIPRAFFAAGRIGNRIYVMGGSETSTVIEYLDLKTLTWNTSPAVMPQGATVKIVGTVTNGLLVAAGGAQGGAFSSSRDWTVLSPNNETYMSGGLNGLVQISSIVDANTFTFNTDIQSYTATGACTATAVGAVASQIAGPFMFDPTAGVAVTGSASTTTQDLNAGLQYSSVTVTNALQFPDAPGWLCFSFGFSNQVTPIRYLGRLSSTALILDYNYVFAKTIKSGSTITLLQQNSPWLPALPQSVGAFYLTDSSAGRIAAQSAISSIAAGGITVNISVTYPGDRGLGNEGYPSLGNYKVSDEVSVWGSDNVDSDLKTARGG